MTDESRLQTAQSESPADRAAAAEPSAATGEFTPDPNDDGRGATSDFQVAGVSGMVIDGRYALLEQIGEGGMGEVWVAQQSEPVRRRVALKLIKAGMDSKAVLQRFEAERQALALMDHPNIARVLDGGMTDDRRPYFVMEMVNGLPLTKFCDEAKLTARQRLELFVPICQAVQHAHQKGIVHRDLKPSNILVTMIDGRPTPKVIDFGVAKATAGKLTDESMSTAFGAVVGTLEYMSPEQAGHSGDDVDTRSDIYSLGVVLYELLTGLRPIDANRLKKAALVEMIRMIQEVEPSKPSTRLSTSDAAPSLAALRQTEPRQLMSILRGELDWVVMKCLEKQRDRRYETANGLARDIQRFLADEPVEARPPSSAYRFRKFVRRNKGQVVAAGLVLTALVAGVVGTSIGMVQAMNAREAESRRAEGERLANEQAQRRLVQIEKANDVLGSIFRTLDPNEVVKEERPLRVILLDKLDSAITQIQGDAIGDPLLVANTQQTLGLSLIGLGAADKALPLIEKSRDAWLKDKGPDHRETLRCQSNLAHGLSAVGKLNDAVALFEETVPRMKVTLGKEDPLTVRTIGNLGVCYKDLRRTADAMPLFEEVLRVMRTQPDTTPSDMLTAMNNLASCYHDAEKLKEAAELYESALQLAKSRLGTENTDTALVMNNLGGVYLSQNKLDRALSLTEESLKLLRLKLGHDHPVTLTTLNNLGGIYRKLDRLPEALATQEDAYRLQKAKLGPDHPLTINLLTNLAGAHHKMGHPEKALPLLEEAALRRLATVGPGNPLTRSQIDSLMSVCRRLEKMDRALPILDEVVKQSQAKLGATHATTLKYLTDYAIACRDLRKMDRALPLFEEILRVRKETLGAEHPETLDGMNNLASGYWSIKRLDKSIPLFEETLKLQEKRLGRDAMATQTTVVNLGVNYRDAGRFDDAIRLLEEGAEASARYPRLQYANLELLETCVRAGKKAKARSLIQNMLNGVDQALPDESPQRAGALAQIAMALIQMKAWDEADPICRESLTIREKFQPDAWTTFNTKAMAGAILLGQKKYAEAEPLLLAGYEGMKKREATIPPQGKERLPEAVERIAQLYDATDRKEEAAKWRKELELMRAAGRKSGQ
ncbi:MAG: serine/threonine-protein kinase [Gemmataceae bacterium]|nr:serine/threonine-protein kinase [Gemmataceae bacterium]